MDRVTSQLIKFTCRQCLHRAGALEICYPEYTNLKIAEYAERRGLPLVPNPSQRTDPPFMPLITPPRCWYPLLVSIILNSLETENSAGRTSPMVVKTKSTFHKSMEVLHLAELELSLIYFACAPPPCCQGLRHRNFFREFINDILDPVFNARGGSLLFA